MQVNKIDANSTGLRYAKELSLKVLPANPVWIPAEPNNYRSFGATFKKVARTPISASRQQSKGVTVDLDAAGGIQQDFTYSNTQTFIEGLLYAAFRAKGDAPVTNVEAAGYDVPNGAIYKPGDILAGSGFVNAANNGPHVLTGVNGNVADFAGAVAEAGAVNGKVSRVGAVLPAGDATMDVSASLPVIRSTAFDFTELGCIPGEWIYIGGDAAGSSFANAVNNGFARVNAIAAHALVLDKTMNVCAADAGAGVSLAIYVGRVVKNEADPMLQVRSTYCIERTLGAPDDTSTAQQAEYLHGVGMNEWVITLNTADKITYELTTVAADYEARSAATGLIAGARPVITDGLAFNTSLNVKRCALAVVGQQSSLFGYLSVGALTVNNNIKPNKAIGVLGAFDTSAGIFAVSATATAYFSNVAALAAVRNNADCSLDMILAAGNKGVAFDCPLVSLGESGLAVAANEAITIPLTMDAGRGGSVNPAMDHTLLIVYFDYLPNRAM